jgi:hypothetical protein
MARGAADRTPVRRAVGAFLVVGLFVAGGQGSAGHSVGHYPSYYPHEIRIEALDPAAAAKRLNDGTLHAYVGAPPQFTGAVPNHLRSARSLGSFLVVSFNTAAPAFASAEARCMAARNIAAVIAKEKVESFVFHPYPITPFHADYVHHVDRVEAARAAIETASSLPTHKVRARGALAEVVAKARGIGAEASGVTLEEVSIDSLIAAAGLPFDGWSGLPWVKEGWFQVRQLLAASLNATRRQEADDTYEHLIRGETIGFTERVNLERSLIASLTDGCERFVLGFAPRDEYFDDRYPEGIENVAFDSLSGINSPVFFRTVKLKEYPWNGELFLGLSQPARAAWNPVAGFSDTTGRLVWSAVGDPAMIHFPFNASWMPNRVQSEVTKVEGQSGGIKVPEDAIWPQPGTGLLQPVGARTVASAKVVYQVLASPFDDGSEMDVADAIYPLAFIYRWGSKASSSSSSREPRLQATFAAIQERLAGLKFLRVERTRHQISEDLTVFQRTPVLELYLRNVPGDERQISALAPPWSTVPWHLLALMEEAVTRGHAAFSEEESRRRAVPWLDLVRDTALRGKLLDLVRRFEREAFRPDALKEYVSEDEARARWRSLRTFAEAKGHFLVANGPYRLKHWTPDTIMLEAVREMTYPLGFGTFDRFVNPPRAAIENATRIGNSIVAQASAEMLLKGGRGYRLTKEPLLRTTMRGVDGLLVVSRYLLIGPDGKVLNVDKMQWGEDGRFTIALPNDLPAGEYIAILAVFLDGNSTLPSAKIVRFRVDGGSASSRG